MAKIFVRERRHTGRQAGRPRFAVVGAQGGDLKFFKTRVRWAELEAIAEAAGAEIVVLPRGKGKYGEHSQPGEHHGEGGGRGHGRRRRDRVA